MCLLFEAQMKKLTPERIEQVRLVLTQPHRSSLDLSKELGISPIWVRRVRRGEKFASLFPELPRETKGRRLPREKAKQLVYDVLTSGLSEKEVAVNHGVHISVVQRVATGVMYSNVLPELVRRKPLSGNRPGPMTARLRSSTCHDCRLFGDDVCSLGFPEASSHKAAMRCAAFWDKDDAACYDAVAV